MIATVLALLIFALLISVAVSLITTGANIGVQELQGQQAFNIAEGGIERALNEFYKTGTSCNSLVYSSTLGNGSFTTDFTASVPPYPYLYNPSPATTLSNNILAADTTIPVASTAGYAPQGRIRIDSEEIFYGSISGNNFINAQRGVAGTTATGHLNTTPVYQNQCSIRSEGSIASNPLANPTKRVVERAVEGISTYRGSFTKPTGVAPVSQAITGIGFRPKAVIFVWTQQTTPPPNFSANANAGIGFATSAANERAVSVTAMDSSNESDAGRRRSESDAIIFLTNGGNVGANTQLIAQAELTSLDADGFTLNWTTNDPNAYRIHFIALGGDITNALASTFTLNTTIVPPTQSVTGVGFQPDFVMFLWSFNEPVDSNRNNAEIGIGFAQSSTARSAMVFADRNNRADNTSKRWQQRTNAAILLLNPNANPPNQDAIADFVSMDADGFTVNKSDAPAANTPVFFLALKGGRHKVDSFNQPAITGNQTITGVGFKPEELLLASFNLIAQAGIVGNGAISIGSAKLPTSRGSIWFQDRSDLDPSEANMYTSTTDVITLAIGSATVNARADFVSFDNDGFTLNWTTADATARQILYWAIGPNVDATNISQREVYP
ncbi:MAG: hypothetical protein HY755_01520 [Nitrospirae bacterium]|nr:hypothetical protein [Nitrospirota bacterium]